MGDRSSGSHPMGITYFIKDFILLNNACSWYIYFSEPEFEIEFKVGYKKVHFSDYLTIYDNNNVYKRKFVNKTLTPKKIWESEGF